MKELLRLDKEGWGKEIAKMGTFFEKFGDRLPQALEEELEDLKKRLG